jgi:dTMP kinase
MEGSPRRSETRLKKGILVTFEGIEGSGKTTQAERACKALELEGYRCVLTREPGGTPVSEKIRSILLDRANMEMTAVCELFLYLACRSQNVSEIIRPALDSGSIVIADRFSDSTRAYQGGGRGLDVEMIAKLNALATDGLKPDLTILVDLDPAKGLSRSKTKDRIENEDIDFHGRVRSEFLTICKEEPNRVIALDGDDAIESIHHEVMALIHRHVEQHAKSYGG